MNFKNLSRKQIIYLSVFGALIAVLLWAFISAGIITHNFNRDKLIGTENRQELDIAGLILTETKEGRKYWELYGETGYYNSDNKVAILENVAGNFYKDNEVTMSFESSKGTYNEIKRQIILYDNTHIVIKDGTSLYTDRLVWSGSDKDVVAKGNVRINRDNELIATAQSAIITPDYATFKIAGKTVTKLYKIKEKK
ncbi:MAG TPA: LPS export ABC transporter periplasmic protein LptC [Candidatus Gastranaerophilaceae bacterium]|nr:LPS export ABC transporter periplasmic protein LptC [Candidatus Gastranaerophilaceae bacterium]HPT42051.1 LPS export ABC transporter periplasmic protein LptC [Candidatus Gastranaerophilaceae bacterium]